MIVYYSRNLILQRVKVLWDHVVMPSKDFSGRNSLHCDIFTLYHWGLPCQRSSLHTNKRKFVSNLLNYQDWLTNREALTVLCSVGKHTRSRKTLGTNTGMRIMQEFFFTGCVAVGHFVNLLFSFLEQKKSITLKRTKILCYFTLRVSSAGF